MKKILSLVLALVLTLSFLPMAFAAEEPSEVSPYQEAIDFLKNEKIWLYHGDGTGDAALEDVTRWQMALFVARFITGETEDAFWNTDENASGFTDVEEFEGCSPATLGAISFASQKGIVNGIGGGLFDPTSNVTYQDAIVMVVRSLGFNYKSSQYPWSYINKARELGLLAGISGIQYTEAAPRGVVAQLLYNALFADVPSLSGDTFTVGETVFGVTRGVAMVTASNRVVFTNTGKKVTRANCVEIKFLNEDGIPAGPAYYVPAFNLDQNLTSEAKIDAAVGTTYYVYYADGEIIKAEPLSEVFWNNALKDLTQIADFKNGSLKVNGITYNLKTAFSDLQHANGTDYSSAKEMVLYQVDALQGEGGDVIGYSKYLATGDPGDIYDITWSLVDPVVYYNDELGIYYEKDGNGGFNLLSEDYVRAKYLVNAQVVNSGFRRITDASKYSNSFAKIVVSDVKGANGEKIAYIQQYYFGQLWTDGNGKLHATIGNDGKWGFDNYVNGTDVYTQIGDLTITAKNSGVKIGIYALNQATKTLEILALEDPDTVSGYLRGWNLNESMVKIGDTEYTYGYDNVKSPAIKSKVNVDNLKNISGMINQYVTAHFFQGKIVWLEVTGIGTNDFIVADQIVAYGQDGITVKAYTTIDNAYKEIKITHINGWQLGGYDADYYLKYLAGIITANPQNLTAPIDTYTLYSVISAANDEYNITVVGDPRVENANFKVYDSDYITGVDEGGNFDSTKLCTKKDNDFWLILIPEYKLEKDGETYPAQIISYNGKLSAIDLSADAYDPSGLDNYKWKTEGGQADRVFIAGLDDDGVLINPDLLDMFADLTASSVEYVLYSYSPYNLGYSLVYNYGSAFGYAVLVYNFKDGAALNVKLDPVKATTYYNEELQVIPVGPEGMEDGEIYVVSDGEILGKYAGAVEDIVTKAYMPSDARNKGGDQVFNIEASNNFDAVATKIAEQIAAMKAEIDEIDDANIPSYVPLFKGNVTIHAAYKENNYVTRLHVAKYNANTWKANMIPGGTMWTVAYIIDKDYNVDAWIIPGDASSEGEGTVVSFDTTSGDMLQYIDNEDDDDTNDMTVTIETDNIAGTAVYTVTIPTENGHPLAFATPEDDNMAIEAEDENGVVYVGSYTLDESGKRIASVTIEDVDAAATQLTIYSIDRVKWGDFTIVVTP